METLKKCLVKASSGFRKCPVPFTCNHIGKIQCLQKLWLMLQRLHDYMVCRVSFVEYNEQLVPKMTIRVRWFYSGINFWIRNMDYSPWRYKATRGWAWFHHWRYLWIRNYSQKHGVEYKNTMWVFRKFDKHALVIWSKALEFCFFGLCLLGWAVWHLTDKNIWLKTLSLYLSRHEPD